VLETAPGEKGFIETLKDDALESLKAFDEATFARAVVTDENGERGKLNRTI
jgi:hypothetical protein